MGEGTEARILKPQDADDEEKMTIGLIIVIGIAGLVLLIVLWGVYRHYCTGKSSEFDSVADLRVGSKVHTSSSAPRIRTSSVVDALVSESNSKARTPDGAE